MTKNEVILVTLISLLKSKALSDTVFTEGKENETLFETLTGELDMNDKDLEYLVEVFCDGDDEDMIEQLERLLAREKRGYLSTFKIPRAR